MTKIHLQAAARLQREVAELEKKEWVGLTNEDLQPMFQKVMVYYGFDIKHLKLTNGAGFCVFAKDIEAKLKEKNT